MILWIVALLVFLSLGTAGFYQGAVRVGCSFLGLLVATALAMPLSAVVKPLLKIFGLEHPVPLGLIAPFVAFVVVVIAFKAASVGLHRKVDGYYKYKASDTVRLLFERLNSRLGLCLGLCNGFIYVILICVGVYVVGYFSVQAATSDKDAFVMKVVTRLAEDMKATRMDKAVAGFIPAKDIYYDGSDVLALIFRNPILQNRLTEYPVFLTYAEQTEFKQLGGDQKFQGEWVTGPSLTEFTAHEHMKELIGNRDLFTNTLARLGGDLKDLKDYLETGKSAKYDEEKILGRWSFHYNQSMSVNRKKKPNMTLNEAKQIRAFLGGIFRNATLTAFLDSTVKLKLPSLPGERSTTSGSWKNVGTGTYTLSIAEGDKSVDVDAVIDGNRLVFSRGPYSLVFER